MVLGSPAAGLLGSSFLPAAFQGTMIRPSDPNPIFDLFPQRNNFITAESERAGLRLQPVRHSYRQAQRERQGSDTVEYMTKEHLTIRNWDPASTLRTKERA